MKTKGYITSVAVFLILAAVMVSVAYYSQSQYYSVQSEHKQISMQKVYYAANNAKLMHEKLELTGGNHNSLRDELKSTFGDEFDASSFWGDNGNRLIRVKSYDGRAEIEMLWQS